MIKAEPTYSCQVGGRILNFSESHSFLRPWTTIYTTFLISDGPGKRKELTKQPVRIVEGRLKSCVTVTEAWIRHVVCLHNSPGVDGTGLMIENDIDLTQPAMNNREIAMRISSGVKSGDVFFTDLNGFQVRIHLHKFINFESNLNLVSL